MKTESKELYLNKLNTLLTQLNPELLNLRLLIKRMMVVDSPYKDKIQYINLLMNKKNQSSTQKNIETFVDAIVEEMPEIMELFSLIVNDDGCREDYVKIGALEEYVLLQSNIGKIVQSYIE